MQGRIGEGGPKGDPGPRGLIVSLKMFATYEYLYVGHC